MSIAHWRSTLQERADLITDLQPLCDLAKKYNKTLTIFDLEGTTLLGRMGFGLTEIGLVHINPSGQIGVAGGLINPENRISRDAQQLTGITHDMVKDQKTWKDGWGEVWSKMAQSHIIAGYNSATFDIPATINQHQRYGLGDLTFAHNWDIFRMKNHAFDTKRGTLAEVARWLDLELDDFSAHRATDDAIMTARVMAKLVAKFPDSLFALEVITGKNPSTQPLLTSLASKMNVRVLSPSPRKDDSSTSTNPVSSPVSSSAPKVKEASMTSLIQAVLNSLVQDTSTDWSSLDMRSLASQVLSAGPHLQKSVEDIVKSMSFTVGAMMDKGEIPLLRPSAQIRDVLAKPEVQHNIKNLWTSGESAGKLAPVYHYLQTYALVDYMDVRWALNEYNLRPCGKSVVYAASSDLQP